MPAPTTAMGSVLAGGEEAILAMHAALTMSEATKGFAIHVEIGFRTYFPAVSTYPLSNWLSLSHQDGDGLVQSAASFSSLSEVGWSLTQPKLDSCLNLVFCGCISADKSATSLNCSAANCFVDLSSIEKVFMEIPNSSTFIK